MRSAPDPSEDRCSFDPTTSQAKNCPPAAKIANEGGHETSTRDTAMRSGGLIRRNDH